MSHESNQKWLDRGAVMLAGVTVAIALATWIHADGVYTGHIIALENQVSSMQTQIRQLQSEFDAYLIRHSIPVSSGLNLDGL
ncbi:MAG: hypothetical protein ACRD22_16535 [Terriglobia bacterium]